jgi:predicted PurR-regulated permease PerM
MNRPDGRAELEEERPAPPSAAGAFPRAALLFLAVLAGISALYLGRAFLIPLLIGALASYALRPVVDALTRVRVPRVLGAALVVAALAGALTWGLASLGDNAVAVIEKLPEAARKLRLALAARRGSSQPLQSVQEAAKELQQAAKEAAGGKPPSRAAAPVPADTAWLQRYLISQSTLLISVVAQAPLVLLLIFFLLASGENFRARLLRVLGPRMSRKEARDVLDQVDTQVQRYLLLILVINLLVGVFTWLSFWALGVDQPELWGVGAAVLHFIPYLGPGAVAVASAGAAYLQFGSVLRALAVAGASLAVATAIGLVVMTWLQSRIAHVNAAVVFVALLFFGWLWGAWGLLLGAPLLAIAKVVCDRLEPLKPVSELLGR